MPRIVFVASLVIVFAHAAIACAQDETSADLRQRAEALRARIRDLDSGITAHVARRDSLRNQASALRRAGAQTGELEQEAADTARAWSQRRAELDREISQLRAQGPDFSEAYSTEASARAAHDKEIAAVNQRPDGWDRVRKLMADKESVLEDYKNGVCSACRKTRRQLALEGTDWMQELCTYSTPRCESVPARPDEITAAAASYDAQIADARREAAQIDAQAQADRRASDYRFDAAMRDASAQREAVRERFDAESGRLEKDRAAEEKTAKDRLAAIEARRVEMVHTYETRLRDLETRADTEDRDADKDEQERMNLRFEVGLLDSRAEVLADLEDLHRKWQEDEKREELRRKELEEHLAESARSFTPPVYARDDDYERMIRAAEAQVADLVGHSVAEPAPAAVPKEPTLSAADRSPATPSGPAAIREPDRPPEGDELRATASLFPPEADPVKDETRRDFVGRTRDALTGLLPQSPEPTDRATGELPAAVPDEEKPAKKPATITDSVVTLLKNVPSIASAYKDLDAFARRKLVSEVASGERDARYWALGQLHRDDPESVQLGEAAERGATAGLAGLDPAGKARQRSLIQSAVLGTLRGICDSVPALQADPADDPSGGILAVPQGYFHCPNAPEPAEPAER